MKDYFNKKSFGPFGPAPTAIISTVLAVGNFAIGSSTSSLVLGTIFAALAVGSINRWQETAKGKPFWKPIIKPFGL